MTENKQLYLWDFTLTNQHDLDVNTLKANLCGSCKKWAFQLETGETGFIHWQGRLSLLKKKRLNELRNFFKDNYPAWDGVHWSPTANNNTTNFNYVMKDDTRTDGPWTDKDEIKFDTLQLKIFKKYEMYKWQTSLHGMATSYNDRCIDLIYDINGNSGKSIFAEYLEYEGIAEEIPPFRLMDDIFQWVCSRPTKKCYIVDLPRGMKKDKLADFYAGIEVIKNGVAYDKRYSAKKKRFDRPRIFVFTNTLPAFNLMSIDRWVVWKIKNNELIEIEINAQDGLSLASKV